MSLAEQLAAVSARAGIHDRASAMEQFRSDFKAVWRWRRDCGDISQVEFENGYAQASTAVREHANDEAWMNAAMADYRRKAMQMERDLERAEHIRAEVRAERERLRKAA